MVSLATFTLLLVAATGVYSASQTNIEKVPSIVQIETGYGRVWLQTCVGTILTSRHVLTAAHCLVGAQNITPRISRVRAGAGQRGRGGQILEVDSSLRHPDYTFLNFDSNVGIIRLQSTLVFGSTVAQATITAPNVNFPSNVPVYLYNWGRTAQNTLWADRDLYSTELITVDHPSCVAKYATLPIPIEVSENMICTTIRGSGNDGTHFGVRDGGAPVFYTGILVGFVAFGSPYGTDYPLLTTAVSPFTQWIVENARF